jgi:hypothetical protein
MPFNFDAFCTIENGHVYYYVRADGRILTPRLDRDSAINLRNALRSGEIIWTGSELRRAVGPYTGTERISFSY